MRQQGEHRTHGSGGRYLHAGFQAVGFETQPKIALGTRLSRRCTPRCKAMHEQVGELRVDENGLALRGVIVRHLVMPGLLEDTAGIVRWLACELSFDTYVNVMDQYYPAWKAKTEAKFSDINREIRESEFEQALACAREAGLWRFDRRWRPVRARVEFVQIPPAGFKPQKIRVVLARDGSLSPHPHTQRLWLYHF